MTGQGTERETVSPGEIGHYVYCPRSWALIAVERLWSDNRFTADGHVLHLRADQGGAQRADQHFHVTVWSDRHGLFGVADRVDLTPQGPIPVEYKSARRLQDDHRAQLAAQALCLEEMFGVRVDQGAVWLGKTRRRQAVELTAADKEVAQGAAEGIREARSASKLPRPVNDRRCGDCSLAVHCMPDAVADRRRAANLYASLFLSPPAS